MYCKLQTHTGVLTNTQHIFRTVSMSGSKIDGVVTQSDCCEGPGAEQCHLPGNTPKLNVAGRPATRVLGVNEGLPGSGVDLAGQAQQQ